ncbi:hypothetical protein P389DRAFT_198861 [Cystobasidium minutum MCA 4210]|uniref:uncharacterized protein n=1 Tax=Cystobasidium minutum MCA 4210 TaxID=1397322 RepID=UPI0034CE3280|eukprot:jgi/Rhomi1/198861/gm1.7075_g
MFYASSSLLLAFALSKQVLAATIESPASVITCQPIAIKYKDAPAGDVFISVIKGGDPSSRALVDLGKRAGPSGSMTWIPNLPADTEITFKLVDKDGQVAFSAALEIQAGSDTSCVDRSISVTGDEDEDEDKKEDKKEKDKKDKKDDKEKDVDEDEEEEDESSSSEAAILASESPSLSSISTIPGDASSSAASSTVSSTTITLSTIASSTHSASVPEVSDASSSSDLASSSLPAELPGAGFAAFKVSLAFVSTSATIVLATMGWMAVA